MTYEWDETKRRTNFGKHRADFEQADVFDWDTARVEPDPRHAEERYRATGFIGDRLHVLVFTVRGDDIRIISLRKATPGEVRRHAAT
ncbi:MAG: BrnT family toxin [Chloroflexi bacterium]|nr:BrnT family toxin [Chloroflexota bacterium]MYK34954.1 BrnT family toxin [Chloroflexota bacterium]